MAGSALAQGPECNKTPTPPFQKYLCSDSFHFNNMAESSMQDSKRLSHTALEISQHFLAVLPIPGRWPDITKNTKMNNRP